MISMNNIRELCLIYIPEKINLLKLAKEEGPAFFDVIPDQAAALITTILNEVRTSGVTNSTDLGAALQEIGCILHELDSTQINGILSPAAHQIMRYYEFAHRTLAERTRNEAAVQDRKRARETTSVSSSSSSSLNAATFDSSRCPKVADGSLRHCANCGHPTINSNLSDEDYESMKQSMVLAHQNDLRAWDALPRANRPKKPSLREPKWIMKCYCYCLHCWLQVDGGTCPIMCRDATGRRYYKNIFYELILIYV
jgi:hypothetical protein